MLSRARRGLWGLLGALLTTWLGPSFAEAQWLEGLSSWSDATVGLSTGKWTGPRVPFPAPAPRPTTDARLDSALWPLSIHGRGPSQAAQLESVLAAAEQVYAQWSAAGFLRAFGDAGQGGTGARDLYLVDADIGGGSAALDASGHLEPLDGARAYALLDARTPRAALVACTAEALIEAELLELDPAEAPSVRRASAAYFATVSTGERPCDGEPVTRSEQSPLRAGAESRGARFLAALSGPRDRNRGTFLHEMWQFARQKTWEGDDLRASPDLLEAIAKALELERSSPSLVMAEAAELSALVDHQPRELEFGELPWFERSVQIEPLGSHLVRVRLGTPRPGSRLRIFLNGEAGLRYALSATRRSQDGQVLARLANEPRTLARSQLSVELDERTADVLVAVTLLEDGTPDFDEPLELRTLSLTLDHRAD